MKNLFTLAAFLSAISFCSAQGYIANLDGLQEVPPNASPSYGLADFSLTGSTLSVTVGNYVDLLGSATAITINDAAIGASGPLLFGLSLTTPGATSGNFTGSGTLTAGQINDLNADGLYVNLRSNVFPSGEIRGQILVAPVPEPSSLLLGAGALAWLTLKRRPRVNS